MELWCSIDCCTEQHWNIPAYPLVSNIELPSWCELTWSPLWCGDPTSTREVTPLSLVWWPYSFWCDPTPRYLITSSDSHCLDIGYPNTRSLPPLAYGAGAGWAEDTNPLVSSSLGPQPSRSRLSILALPRPWSREFVGLYVCKFGRLFSVPGGL